MFFVVFFYRLLFPKKWKSLCRKEILCSPKRCKLPSEVSFFGRECGLCVYVKTTAMKATTTTTTIQRRFNWCSTGANASATTCDDHDDDAANAPIVHTKMIANGEFNGSFSRWLRCAVLWLPSAHTFALCTPHQSFYGFCFSSGELSMVAAVALANNQR